MGSRSYSTAVEEIKARANIVDVIGSLTNLRKAGSIYKACCPFHNEKTPSFVVYESTQIYVCFGCGEKGDVIRFVEKYYNLTFAEAVERLANQYGIVIEEDRSENAKKKDVYYELNRLAARFFYDGLTTRANPGYAYISKRGIEAQTIRAFGLGFADDQWQSLCDYMKEKGADPAMLKEISLLSEKEGRYYDKFRGRVMFPIFNTRGNVIGFGGRIIGDGDPKYLNSSESFIFKKGCNLYGLNLTKNDIQKENLAILVEGYMDVVSLYQNGVRNVAASLGTALTEDQARLLKRYTSQVVLCYDADAAGMKAALRGIDVLRKAGLGVRVLHVDEGKDPDEYIKRNGRDAFLRLIREKSVADIDYKIRLLRKNYSLNDTSQSIRFLQDAAAVLRSLSPVEADIYIKKVASAYSISEGALRREVEKGQTEKTGTASEKTMESTGSGEERPVSQASQFLERTLIRLSMLKSEYFRALENYPEAFVTENGQKIRDILRTLYRDGCDFDLSDLRDSLEDGPYQYLEFILNNVLPGENDRSAFEDCIRKLDADRRKQRIAEINSILSFGEKEGNQFDMTSLMRELIDLQKQDKK